MFTPQKKVWPNVTGSFTLHRGGVAMGSASAKEKAVADGPPPPPLGSLTETTVAVGFDTGNAEDWRRFTELGLLDESVMQRKDHEALLEKVSRLERELFDYQYNMGLLLMEKKEWNSKFDQLRQELAETEEILKREQSAHLFALFEVEKREENLRKALSTERQCGADLERALRAMQEEHAQVKSNSHTKLAEASALVDGIEEKSSVVDKKLLDAEAKLAEVNRKNAELDMKLQEVEARESLLLKERLSLATDRESFDATFYKEREDLKEWERKLQQRENMLSSGWQNISEKEKKIVETEKNLKQKERDLEVLEKKVNSSSSLLKEKEAEIIRRIANINVEEKKVDSLKSTLEMKEKELFALESKLNSREREGIQKVLGEQKATLDLQLQQVDFEMEHKRKSLLEEFSSKEEALEQREAEVNHRGKKVEKEEQALSKKAERIKEQSKEIEAKLKSLKEKEKTLKIKEKELEKENQQLVADRETLENLNAELQRIKAEISLQELQIQQETENLKLAEDDRLENSRLRLELKQEIEHTRLQKDSLVKEAENLREERERFEKEWEVLDEKREEITRKQHDIDVEKESLRKFQHSEEERLKSEKQSMQEQRKKELEKLELEKESFRDSMNQEKHLLSEKVKNEQAKMLQDFESKMRNLENEIQKRQEEMEEDLQERERNFQEKMQRELDNINILKNLSEREWEEAKAEGIRLENERKELELNKQQFQSGQLEMREDSEMLMNLSQKVKKERQRLVAERKNFLELVENLKNCKVCGEFVGNFVLSDTKLSDLKESVAIPLPISPVLNYKSPDSQDIVATSDIDNSGSVRPVSWFHKCTSKFFKLSPTKRAEAISASDMAGTSPSDVNDGVDKADEPASLPNIEGARVSLDERQPAVGMAYHSLDTPHLQSDNIDKEVGDEHSLSIGEHSRVDSVVDGDRDDSQQSVPKLHRARPGRKSKSGIARTRSVKAVVEEAREFLAKENSPEDSSRIEKANTGRKRQRAQTSRVTESEQTAGDSEGQSESITAGGRRKKRQTVAPPAHVTGEKRYNLRQHKTAGKGSSKQALRNATRSVGKEAVVEGQMRPEVVETSLAADDNVQVQDKSMVQVTTTKTVEVSDERVVRFEVPRDIVDDNGAAEENGTSEYRDEDGSTIHDVENDDDDYEDEDEEHLGEVSTVKKIFRFFTT
ncbi:protein CROWDED NUCLEI 3 isoform X1 [Vigna radiata var. radiata]|uniref:Protein CROWDED NUCLEI 3 isoform X1 n=2 Tax=Vigna radiata var. radiata TaxID=3916 RepID=A0A1S3VP37_VIGRR|nr:protein CROWDED NUCLEI 3 isoform X1 [Vigna radiata var. radiata]